MTLRILETPGLLGRAAAEKTAAVLNEAIEKNGRARLLMSTGASQFETIEHLRGQRVDWAKVELFHLDEYIGIDDSHPASFVKYLRERFVRNDIPLKHAYFLNGGGDPARVIAEMSAQIKKAPVDAALIGIGENGHIAFNDPPADFDTAEAFIIVKLDEACKRQQVREGWYAKLSDVPKYAVTMTVSQIMDSRAIISAVPHSQKAEAVRNTLEGETSSRVPASILKTHGNWSLYLDKNSAALLNRNHKPAPVGV